jgi:hypothetical protein
MLPVGKVITYDNGHPVFTGGFFLPTHNKT